MTRTLNSPGDKAALRELKALQAASVAAAPSPDGERAARVAGLREQIATAMATGTYFPPAPSSAWTLVQQLGALSPSDPVFKEKMDQLHREAVSQLQRKIQTKDANGARALARQFQDYFPASAELRGLRESLRTDEIQQQEARRNLTQKLEAALAHSRYVTPASDNALAYCNHLLALDPQNATVPAQKQEIYARAAAQAKELISNEKFDEARDVLSAMATFAQSEGRAQVVQQARAQLDGLEFTAYPVIHNHALGSCSGRLRMNAHVIAYVPSTDSKDGFSQPLSDIAATEPGDKLKIQFKGKTYRFQPNLVKGKEETRQKVQEIQQKLASLMAKTK